MFVFVSESEGVFNASPPAGLMWMEQLSPHLQRNKQVKTPTQQHVKMFVFDFGFNVFLKCFQLQDTLLQREEELARLQEENNKLREFLSSSFVRDLEKKAKVCSP